MRQRGTERDRERQRETERDRPLKKDRFFAATLTASFFIEDPT